MEQSYKEKYEQALERARVWKDKSGMPKNKQGILDDIFPELAESEGEVTRKEIINYFHCQSEEEPTRKEIHNKWIAWLENIPYTIDHEKREGFHLGYKACLERQGEQNPTLPIWKYKKDNTPLLRDSIILNKYGCVAKSPSGAIVSDVWIIDYDELAKLPKEERKLEKIEQKSDSYCKEHCKGFQETGKCFADGECKAKREAEQKPVIKFKTAEESLGISSDEYNKIVDECLFGEQKLTEFERGLFDMLTDISKPRTADCVKSHSEKLLSIARKMIALEQKPEENKGNIEGISPNWSEEDEKIINGLIDSLTRISLNTRTDSTSPNYSFYREIDWLKSLRPQSRWKPSDKQMEVLWFYAEQNDYDGAVLTSLYNDLKKLKEE